jgi:hypothetical protein
VLRVNYDVSTREVLRVLRVFYERSAQMLTASQAGGAKRYAEREAEVEGYKVRAGLLGAGCWVAGAPARLCSCASLQTQLKKLKLEHMRETEEKEVLLERVKALETLVQQQKEDAAHHTEALEAVEGCLQAGDTSFIGRLIQTKNDWKDVGIIHEYDPGSHEVWSAKPTVCACIHTALHCTALQATAVMSCGGVDGGSLSFGIWEEGPVVMEDDPGFLKRHAQRQLADAVHTARVSVELTPPSAALPALRATLHCKCDLLLLLLLLLLLMHAACCACIMQTNIENMMDRMEQLAELVGLVPTNDAHSFYRWMVKNSVGVLRRLRSASF